MDELQPTRPARFTRSLPGFERPLYRPWAIGSDGSCALDRNHVGCTAKPTEPRHPYSPTTFSRSHCSNQRLPVCRTRRPNRSSRPCGATTVRAWSAVNVSPTLGISICHQVFCHGSRLAGAGCWLDGRPARHTSAKGRMDNAP